MKIALVTLTTDFGLTDPFVGMMKGVIVGISPAARLVDLTHQIPPQAVTEAAMVLKHAIACFPKPSLHVVVVDPGVGGQRDVVLVRTPGALFLAPDNGVLTYALEGQKIVGAWQVTNQHYFLKPVSATFHGRDIFAPVAGHLMRGVNPNLFGPPAGALKLLPSLPSFQMGPSGAQGIVLGADHFGNLLTNLPQGPFQAHPVRSVNYKGQNLPLAESYSSVPEGALGAIWGCYGYLEVFQRNGSAAGSMQAKVGDQVMITF